MLTNQVTLLDDNNRINKPKEKRHEICLPESRQAEEREAVNGVVELSLSMQHSQTRKLVFQKNKPIGFSIFKNRERYD